MYQAVPRPCLATTSRSLASRPIVAASWLSALFQSQSASKGESIHPNTTAPIQPVRNYGLAERGVDSKVQARNLARARQRQHLDTAIVLLRMGWHDRAHEQLANAMRENSVCRTPCARARKAQQEDSHSALYRLHIRCTASEGGEPSLGSLLQLQEMLGLSQEEAEAIELDMLCSTSVFTV